MKRKAPDSGLHRERSAQLARGALSRAPVFSDLHETQRRRLGALSRIVRLRPGERLWNRGDAADHLGVVVSGRLKQVRESASREVLLDLAVPGDLLGEVAFASRVGTYQSTVVSLRQARVLLVPSGAFKALLRDDAELTSRLALRLAQSVVAMMKHVEALSETTVERRLARVLANLADRAGEPFQRGVFIPARLRRRDLANLAATTLESTSRKISAWSRLGILTPQPAGYLIHDLARLRRLADGG